MVLVHKNEPRITACYLYTANIKLSNAGKKLKPIQIRNDVQQTEHFLDFLERTAETTNKQITFSYYVQH